MSTAATRIGAYLADGESIQLPVWTFGWLFAQLGDDAAFAFGSFDSSAAFSLLGSHGAVSLVDAPANFCIFADSGQLTLKNNTGGPETLRVELFAGNEATTLADGASVDMGAGVHLGGIMLGDHDAFALFWTDTAGIITAKAGHNYSLVDIPNKLCLLTVGANATGKNNLGSAKAVNEHFVDSAETQIIVADSGSTSEKITSAGWGWITAPNVPAFGLFTFSADGATRNLIFSDGAIGLVSAPGTVGILGGSDEIEIENRTGGPEVFHYKLTTWPTIDDVEIDDYSDRVFGCHLRPGVTIYGEGFVDGLALSIDGELAVITIVSDAELYAVLPMLDPGLKDLVFYYPTDPASTIEETNAALWSDAGYKELRAHLPPRRYTDDPEDMFNIVLALIGQENDRIYWARKHLMEKELFPETTVKLIARHETHYGVSPDAGDDLAARRLRVVLKSTAAPSISVPYLEAIVQAALAAGTITENTPYSDYGELVWQYQVYESTPNELSGLLYGILLSQLEASGPGYTRPAIGAEGFIVDVSKCDRDFVSDVE